MDLFAIPAKTRAARSEAVKTANVVFPAFISCRKDKAGNATRGLHEYGVDLGDGSTPIPFDPEFAKNYLNFLESEAKRMGGKLGDRGCRMMIPYISPDKARVESAEGRYTVPNVALCSELHAAVKEYLGLRELGKPVAATAPAEAPAANVAPEDVPF